MSSEEDFSVVTIQSSPEDQPQVPATIGDCLELVDLTVSQQQMMFAAFDSSRPGQENRAEKLHLEEARLNQLRQEEDELLKKIQSVKAALSEEESLMDRLNQQEDVLSRLPQRDIYLGLLTASSRDAPAWDIKSRVVYPMDGGTALITFDEDAVAKQILKMKKHIVLLECGHRITVEAQPVQLVVPKQVEMDSVICSRRILVSNLPQMEAESLVDKLGFHFSKKANGGGEVENCWLDKDSGTVVILFSEEGIVDALVHKEFHNIGVHKATHTVRVGPFISGQMSRLEAKVQACSRTVLLTGIPDVLDQDTLQDILAVHFQKGSNGGGEILQCLYNPVGQCTSAIFTG
ncbi:interferon-induced protein 35 isoform X3 [Takifugu flavidus]|uniref:interferon-induced protein 35 isoform X3 n=1 Tax=Takifugu flavidus TaxID=433684 RepID=UPI0025447A4E|nr:interferon-induced protein 35 isoform X3 [Takifugu flavidus]